MSDKVDETLLRVSEEMGLDVLTPILNYPGEVYTDEEISVALDVLGRDQCLCGSWTCAHESSADYIYELIRNYNQSWSEFQHDMVELSRRINSVHGRAL